MDLKNLLHANTIDRWLADRLYVDRIKRLYPDYEIFVKQSDPDFLYFRKKIGQSTFGIKPNQFTVDITTDVKVHYTQLCKIS